MPRKKGVTNKTPSEIERKGKSLIQKAKLKKKIEVLRDKIQSRS